MTATIKYVVSLGKSSPGFDSGVTVGGRVGEMEGLGLAVEVGLVEGVTFGEGDGLDEILGVVVGEDVEVAVGVVEGEGKGLGSGISPVQDIDPEKPVIVHLALTVIVGVPETGPIL